MQIQTLKLPITRISPLNSQPALLPLALAKVVTWPSDNCPSCPESNLSCVVASLSRVWLFVIPWTEAHQTSLSLSISQSFLKFMSTDSVMPSNHLILCRPLLLLPSIFPSIRVFSNESASTSGGQSIGASASASDLPMNIQGWFPLGWTGWISCCSSDSQESPWAPLVAQWMRICLPTQGTWVQFLVREIPHATWRLGPWSQLLRREYREQSPLAATRESCTRQGRPRAANK